MSFLRKDEPFKVASVAVGKGPGMTVCTYAFPSSEMGTPTVGFGNHLDDHLHHMSPDTARAVAAALMQAADAVALEEVQRGATHTVDRIRTVVLATTICAAVREHIGRPPAPEAVLEALNALATSVALLVGATANRPLARQFFDDALRKELSRV